MQASDILLDGAALPSWITFTAEGADAEYTASTSSLNIDPTFAEIGTYIITVTYTPNNGSPLTDLTVINLTVQCLVASFTKPADPDNIEYTIYNDEVEFEMTSLEYVQAPACGYPHTILFTWDEGTDDYITGSSDGLF